MPNSYLELRHITQLEVNQFFSKFGTGYKFLNRIGKTKYKAWLHTLSIPTN